jgi:hypothetical protein
MREFKQYLIALIVLTIAVSGFVFLRFANRYPFPIGPQFDAHIRQRYTELLNRQEPQILVFGDSVVETNVDTGLMAGRLEKRVSAISEAGAGSALLHLILKNNIVHAQPKPDILVLLFRDTVLTSPGFRVQGRFFEVMDEYGGADDDLTLKLAVRDELSPAEEIAEAYFPPYWGRWDIRALVVTRGINLPVRLVSGCTQECIEESMDVVFGNQNFEADQLNETINSAENFLYSAENLDFDRQVDQSFLPEIIRICRENNIRLVLVRTKTLRFSTANPEPRALMHYIQDLRAYTQENNVTMIDFAHDQRLDESHFRDVHHLTPEGKEIFSAMLSEELKSMPLP